jgi:TPR repeat protein
MNGKASIDWYKTAAEQGMADAQYTLGVMHLYGHGVRLDHSMGAL